MSIRDYEVYNDKFELDDESMAGSLCFPCAVCLFRDRNQDEYPCDRCGHNANSRLFKKEMNNDG